MKVKITNCMQQRNIVLLDDSNKIVDEVARYLRFLNANGKSPNTIRSYAYDLKIYYSFLKKRDIQAKDICSIREKGPVDIFSDFILWLQYPDYSDGLVKLGGERCARTNRTINRTMEAVLSFYQYLASNNELQELDVYKLQRLNPMIKSFLYELVQHKTELMVSIFKKPVIKGSVSYISRDNYKSLISLCTQKRDRVLLELLFEGGLRIGEALGLHYSDLQKIEDGIIEIIPRENNENGARVKENAGGVILLPPYVISDLIQYINEVTPRFNSNYLFLTLRGKNAGMPLTANNVEQLFMRLSRQSGKKVTPHMLRHGFATEKLHSGWQMIDIKNYLRHSTMQSTMIYAEYSDQLKKEMMRKFIESKAEEMKEIYETTKHK